jgi:1,4-alpha-glucan branching enzyme
MPYVEGFDTWPFGEEWLWEAVATVYLPLLERLEAAPGGAPLTLGLTPVLCDQLETLHDGPAGERLLSFLRGVRSEVHTLDEHGLRAGGFDELAGEVRRAGGDYVAAAAAFEARGRDLLGGFRRLEGVELWTSAATHALLPLVATDAGLALQLATGARAHERRFGRHPAGFWLPECAYVPGLERDLSDHGVRAFCVDQTAAHGVLAPEHLRPVATEAGAVAVRIDWGTIELVWNERSGYPVDGVYRDYHRRTVHDLRPWNNGGGAYRPEQARALAREHARDFVQRALSRLEHGGLLCCALDTELLGHWWYEGLEWLSALLEEAPARGLELVTVSEGLERVETQAGELAASSWGRGKDLSTWDSPAVAELAFAARAAELTTVGAAAQGAERAGLDRARLERAARELLALQSSDWAFLITRDLAADYPQRRARAHAAGVKAALTASRPDPALRNLAPDLDLASLCAP